MADFRCDQAAGLRRLLTPRALRVVSFASGAAGVGKTTVVANTAVVLARQGLEVLVVDENAPSHLGAFFGLKATGDLLQVINRQRKLESVLFSPLPGLSVLPAGEAARQLGHLSERQKKGLRESLHALVPDVILIDATLARDQGFSPWGLAASDVVMVVSASGEAITESYALIKKISLAFSRRHFRILVNRVRQPEDGLRIFANLKSVAAKSGVAHLEYGGVVPLDPALEQVGRLVAPVVELLPDAPAARALRGFASILPHWPKIEGEDTRGVEQFLEQLLNFVGQQEAESESRLLSCGLC
ncbi:MAG: AAA family ATPase [Zoogloeaceae bacterium]|nr:AAA family ATPase [Zoogloeaceae bacterium]